MNNSSTFLIFNVKPLSFKEKHQQHKRVNDRDNSDSLSQNKRIKSPNDRASGLGWINYSGPFSFHNGLSGQPCKFFALVGKECDKPRNTCQYVHRSIARGFRRPDQAILCKWVKETSNVEWASHIKQSDKSITHTARPANGNGDTYFFTIYYILIYS